MYIPFYKKSTIAYCVKAMRMHYLIAFFYIWTASVLLCHNWKVFIVAKKKIFFYNIDYDV
jgi:hypothetical protein